MYLADGLRSLHRLWPKKILDMTAIVRRQVVDRTALGHQLVAKTYFLELWFAKSRGLQSPNPVVQEWPMHSDLDLDSAISVSATLVSFSFGNLQKNSEV